MKPCLIENYARPVGSRVDEKEERVLLFFDLYIGVLEQSILRPFFTLVQINEKRVVRRLLLRLSFDILLHFLCYLVVIKGWLNEYYYQLQKSLFMKIMTHFLIDYLNELVPYIEVVFAYENHDSFPYSTILCEGEIINNTAPSCTCVCV